MNTAVEFVVALALTAMPCGGEIASTGSTDVVWEGRIEVDSGRRYRGPWRMNESRFLRDR